MSSQNAVRYITRFLLLLILLIGIAIPKTRAETILSCDDYKQIVVESIMSSFKEADNIIASDGIIELPLVLESYDPDELSNTIKDAVLTAQLSIPEFRCVVDPYSSMAWHLEQTDSDPVISIRLPLRSETTYKLANIAAQSIVDNAPSCSDLDKIIYYISCLHKNAKYDQEAAKSNDKSLSKRSIDPAICLGAVPGKAVCESYARALQMLCDRTTFEDPDLTCITVLGSINNICHMFNFISVPSEDLDKREWLLCDPTNANTPFYSTCSVSDNKIVTPVCTYTIDLFDYEVINAENFYDNISPTIPSYMQCSLTDVKEQNVDLNQEKQTVEADSLLTSISSVFSDLICWFSDLS